MNFPHDKTTIPCDPCVSCPNDGKWGSGIRETIFIFYVTITNPEYIGFMESTDAIQNDMLEIEKRNDHISISRQPKHQTKLITLTFSLIALENLMADGAQPLMSKLFFRGPEKITVNGRRI